MTEDEIKSKQEETLKNLNKFNENRKTEMIDDSSEEEVIVSGWPTEEEIEAARKIVAAFERAEKGVTIPPMQEWLDAQDALNKERGISIVEETEPVAITDNHPLGLPLLCQWCGDQAYPGQIHGLGYCKEKIKYEQ